ncbi:MAG: VOC family protein [Luteolibacter sp.]
MIASDYARSKHFYTEVLGLRIFEETHRAEPNSYKLDLAIVRKTKYARSNRA